MFHVVWYLTPIAVCWCMNYEAKSSEPPPLYLIILLSRKLHGMGNYGPLMLNVCFNMKV